MTRKSLAILALVLAAVLFVAVNIVAQGTLRDRRLDLTEDGLYTLSPGTLNVIAAVKEPVTLRLFYSESLAREVPALRTYGSRVRELLDAYASRSAGRIRLEVIDPEPYSETEDRAVEAGVRGVPLDRDSGRSFYFGLVGTNTVDRQEVIPFFQQEREAFLEYDLTKLVYALTDPKRPVVGVLTAMPLEYGPGGMMAAMRGGAQPYAILSQLRAFFDVRVLEPGAAAIAPDVSVLVVARPSALPEAALYAIDQYVLKGGRAVFFVDPFAESDMGQPGAPPDPAASKAAVPARLFEAWGIVMPADRFVADPRLALSVTAGEGGRRRAVPYPAWLSVGEANRDPGDVVTAQIGAINLASAGSLSVKPDAGLTLLPLITSSPAAQMVPTSELQGRADPEKLLASLRGGDGSARVLAARIKGPLKTAFPDGPPPPKEGEAPAAADRLTASAQPAELIVVADSDLIEDRFWVEDQGFGGQSLAVPFAGNGDFILNAVENLTGSSDLTGLRGRAGSARPFVVVEELRREAGEQMVARERELTQRLRDTERRIADLQGKAQNGGGPILSADEQQAVERFRAEVVRTRKELREVQRTLNRDIERLATAVKAVNIVAVPLVVVAAAFGVAGVRAQRRNARPARD